MSLRPPILFGGSHNPGSGHYGRNGSGRSTPQLLNTSIGACRSYAASSWRALEIVAHSRHPFAGESPRKIRYEHRRARAFSRIIGLAINVVATPTGAIRQFLRVALLFVTILDGNIG